MRSSRSRVFVVLAVLVLLAGLGTAPASATGHGPWWSGSWATAVQRATMTPILGPDWSAGGFADQTVRQVVRLSTGGPAVRVRLSNAYGATPLELAGATIARSAGGAAIRPESVRPLTFGHRHPAVIPAGGELASDPVALWTSPLESLTVTLYFAKPTGPSTYHWSADATSYRATGDHRADADAAAFTETTTSWYYLSGVDVAGVPPWRDAVVTFGDSITEGALSTVDANNRYSDELAERFAATGKPRGVLNEGIGGNRVLNDSPCFGDKATSRFHRDVVEQPRVRSVIVLEGINDIGSSASQFECFVPNPRVTAAQLIAAHRQLIRDAHANGIRVVGATLLPFKGAGYYSEAGEAVRDELNTWIRTSGAYDAVVDFDRAMADPADPDTLRPAYDSGDHLHPNDTGYHAMAEAIDLGKL